MDKVQDTEMGTWHGLGSRGYDCLLVCETRALDLIRRLIFSLWLGFHRSPLAHGGSAFLVSRLGASGSSRFKLRKRGFGTHTP